MKKLIFILVCLVILMLGVACNSDTGVSEGINNNSVATDGEHSHSFSEWTTTTSPFCTSQGVLTRTCNSCGFAEYSQVPPLGHTEIVDMAIAATCTTDGKTAGKHCSVCNTVLVAQTTIGALGHTEVVDKEVPSTCTAKGKTEGKHCGTCNTIIVAQAETPIVAHTYDDKYDASCNVCGHERDAECAHLNQYTITGRESTCKLTGLTDGKYCPDCKTHIVVQTVIPVKPHAEVIDKAVAATCKTTGLTEGKHCESCGDVLIAQTKTPLAEHNYDSTVIEPTVTQNGSAEHNCSVCGHSYSEVLIPVDFTITKSNRAQIGYTGAVGENLVIPEVFEFDGTWYRVVSISDYAFEHCSKLASVAVPESVKRIGFSVFSYCRSLESLTLPFVGNRIDTSTTYIDGLFTYIFGSSEYEGSVLVRQYYGIDHDYDSTKYMPASLKNVTITGGALDDFVFRNCSNLVNINLSSSVTSIGDGVFAYCTSLQSIEVVIPIIHR